jgi:type II restriction/modification system DNA methylase subunit YeeA
LGLAREFPRIGPEAVKGIEINPYAAELARVTVWIGEIQWMRRNGFDVGRNPILKPLDTIECRDAILNPDGSEAESPEADVVIGNPPFLGETFMRDRLGPEYTETLRSAYSGRVPGGADLVCLLTLPLITTEGHANILRNAVTIEKYQRALLWRGGDLL